MRVKKADQITASRGDGTGGSLLSKLDALPERSTDFADFKKRFDGLFSQTALLAQEHVDRLLDRLFSKHLSGQSTIWFLHLLCALKPTDICIRVPVDVLEVLRQGDVDKLLAHLLHRRAISVCAPQPARPSDNSQGAAAASFDHSASTTTNRIKADLQTLAEAMDVNDAVRQRLYSPAQMNTLHLLQRQHSYWTARAFGSLPVTSDAALTMPKRDSYEEHLMRTKGEYDEMFERYQAIFHHPMRFKRMRLRSNPLHRYHLRHEGPRRAQASSETSSDVITRPSSTSLLEDARDMPSLF